MEGWVSFHRKITEWEWYTDPNTFRLFFHLILMANNSDGNWRGTPVKRGQHITSIKKLSDALNITEKQVRTSMEKLKKTGEVTCEGTNKYTVVTIEKYDVYQESENKTANNTVNKGQTKGKRKATKGQSKGNQRATNNNENNENNEDNKKTYSDFLPLNDAIHDFIDFRLKLGKPMTEKAVSLLITRLNKFTNNLNEQIDLLNEAILRGWMTVYAPDKSVGTNSRRSKSDQYTVKPERTYTDEELEKRLLNRRVQ